MPRIHAELEPRPQNHSGVIFINLLSSTTGFHLSALLRSKTDLSPVLLLLFLAAGNGTCAFSAHLDGRAALVRSQCGPDALYTKNVTFRLPSSSLPQVVALCCAVARIHLATFPHSRLTTVYPQ